MTHGVELAQHRGGAGTERCLALSHIASVTCSSHVHANVAPCMSGFDDGSGHAIIQRWRFESSSILLCLSQPCWGRAVPVACWYELAYGAAINRSWARRYSWSLRLSWLVKRSSRRCHLTNNEREGLLDAFLSVCHWQKVYYAWRPNLLDEADKTPVKCTRSRPGKRPTSHMCGMVEQ